MNSLQVLKKGRNRNFRTCHLPTKSEARSFEGRSAPSQPNTLLPTPGAQVLGLWPLLSSERAPLYSPDSLLCAPLPGGPLFSQLFLPLPRCENRGWSPHLRASMQPAGGGNRQARSSQPAAGRSQYPAGRNQEFGPRCDRQAVSTERGRKPDRSAPPLPLAPQIPPAKCIMYCAAAAPIRCHCCLNSYLLVPIQSPASDSSCHHSSSSCLILPFPTFLFSFLFSLYIYLLSLQSSFSYSSFPPS